MILSRVLYAVVLFAPFVVLFGLGVWLLRKAHEKWD